MEAIRGKRCFELDVSEFTNRIAAYEQTWIDLGTGDGRFTRWMAARQPERFFVGIDACRENLRAASRKEIPNLLFVIASAQSLPPLGGVAAGIYINFPWGSLLAGLLDEPEPLVNGLAALCGPRAQLHLHLNAEALAEFDRGLESGADQIQNVLEHSGWSLEVRACMDAPALRAFPSTWAKRLAFGRDPRAIHLRLRRA